jgi:oligosaccharide repeat unit polymerase
VRVYSALWPDSSIQQAEEGLGVGTMSPDNILFLFISIMIMLFPFFHSLATGKFDLLSPPAIFASGFTASYGIKGWLVGLDPNDFLTYPDLFSFDQDAVITAYILSWLGLIMFFVGYYMKPPKIVFLRLTISIRGFKITYFVAALFCLLAVLSISLLIIVVLPNLSLLAALYGIENIPTAIRDSLMGSWNDFPMLFHFPVYIGFFGMVAIHARNMINEQNYSKNHVIRSTFFIASIVFLTLVVLGSRQILLTFALALVLYSHYFVKRISGYKQLIVLILVVLLGGYLGIVQKSLDPSMAKAADMPFPKNIAFRLSSSYEQFETLAGVITKGPPIEWGRTFFEDIFVTYIPRNLWPSKPTDFGFIRAQNVLFSDYWILSRDSTYPIGILGELYYNFGHIGIPFGMFFLGLILKAMRERSKVAHSLWPPIFVTVIATSLAPHRAFGSILLTFCLYILFAKMVQFLAALMLQKQRGL